MALITNQGGGNMNKFKLFPKATWPNIYASFRVGGGAPREREIMVHRLGENIKNFFYVVISEATGSRVKSLVR